MYVWAAYRRFWKSNNRAHATPGIPEQGEEEEGRKARCKGNTRFTVQFKRGYKERGLGLSHFGTRLMRCAVAPGCGARRRSELVDLSPSRRNLGLVPWGSSPLSRSASSQDRRSLPIINRKRGIEMSETASEPCWALPRCGFAHQVTSDTQSVVAIDRVCSISTRQCNGGRPCSPSSRPVLAAGLPRVRSPLGEEQKMASPIHLCLRRAG